jgi:hyperosmotically inducible protein
MKRLLLGCALVAAVGCNDPATRSSPSGSGASGTVNTAVNVRDRNDATKTPIDQNENTRDVGITADIRKRVVALDASVNAHNVKIITQDGRVTLRGPVETADEKRRIEEIAFEVAGKANVDSQLEVEAAK